MNSNRLPTELRSSQDQEGAHWPSPDFDKLLMRPLNLEEDGKDLLLKINRSYPAIKIKVDVQELNSRLVTNTFDSIYDCAKFLDVPWIIVKNKLEEGQPVITKKGWVYVKSRRVVDNSDE